MAHAGPRDRATSRPASRTARTAMQVSHHLLLSHGLALQALRADGCRSQAGHRAQPVAGAAGHRLRGRRGRGPPGGRPPGALVHGPAVQRAATRHDVLDYLGADAPRVRAGRHGRPSPRRWTFSASTTTRASSSAPTGPGTQASSGRDVTEMGWEVYPEGLTELLVRLHRDYPVPPLYVTENGGAFSDELEDGQVHDAAAHRLHRAPHRRRRARRCARACRWPATWSGA